MISFEKVKNAILQNPSIVSFFLPDGVKIGNEYRCANIFGGKGESFSINIVTGLWSDFATGETGSSLLDLLVKRGDFETFKDAAEFVAKRLGGEYIKDSVSTSPEPKTKEKDDILIPKKPPFAYPTHLFIKGSGDVKIDSIWAYKNEDGNIIAFDARVDRIDESGKQRKDVFPLRYNGKKWYTKALPSPRPLFNLDKLTKDVDKKKQVLVVEGCKTVSAAEHYFPNLIVTTWQGGCKAVDLADFSPLYGRSVIIVPDADKLVNPKTNECYPWELQPGMKAAEKIADKLCNHGGYVRIVDTKAMSEIKSGWDIADALAGGMSQSDLISFIKKNIYEYVHTNKGDVVEPEVIVQEKDSVCQYDDTYFRCLGVSGKNHYFFQKKSGQVICFAPSSYKKENLISLAPLSFWESSFPQKNGVCWEAAVDWLCRTQESCGIYDKSRIRGRGAWFDNGKPVLHLGTSLFVDGSIRRLDEFVSSYIYEKSPALAVKLQTVLPKEDASKLIEICRLARWEQPYYGDILAGWMFSAMVCGAMPFRSHLYMIGASGSGKSWMLDNVIKIVMGRMSLSVSSKTTEPGIREALGGDILPVLFDEAEAENKQDKARIQAIFDLSRQASSEFSDAIYKGGSNGSGGFSYLCRSSFLFASINNSMTKDADLSRTTVIKLKSPPQFKSELDKSEDVMKFKALERMSSVTLTEEYCRCLLTRAIQFIPVMRKSAKVIADICAKEYGSKRIGDQLGMILSGTWHLQNDRVIREHEAIELLEYCSIRKEQEETGECMTQEERSLNFLLRADIQLGQNKYPLSMVIAYLAGVENIPTVIRNYVENILRNKGILVTLDSFVLSRNDKCLPSIIYEGTEWDGRGWKDALLRIDGIKAEKARRFSPSLVSGAIVIPLSLILK